MNGPQIVQMAKEQLNALTGLRPDTVSKMLKSGEGWRIVVEMVEMKAVPDSKDLLATYETTLDDEGNLLSYERTARYRRGDVN
jgi:Gas vesicle synthesis protein GvpO